MCPFLCFADYIFGRFFILSLLRLETHTEIAERSQRDHVTLRTLRFAIFHLCIQLEVGCC